MIKTVSEVKPQSQLLTIPVVAERLGISTRKTWQLISQGQLPAVHISLRSTRIAEVGDGFSSPRDIDQLAFRTVARRPVSADGHVTKKDTCSLFRAGFSRCLLRDPTAPGDADYPRQQSVRQALFCPDQAV